MGIMEFRFKFLFDVYLLSVIEGPSKDPDNWKYKIETGKPTCLHRTNIGFVFFLKSPENVRIVVIFIQKTI